MSTTIRPELSKKNPYWIEKHRYYELKHFCMQYPTWKKACAAIDGLSKSPSDSVFIKTTEHGDPTVRCAEARMLYLKWMELVEQAAKETDAELGTYILEGVTRGIPYNILKLKMNIPCCKDVYYEQYRRFFWILDQVRA